MIREHHLAQYAHRLRDVLLRVEPKKPDLGVRLLLEKALRLERSSGLSLEAALEEVLVECERRVDRMLAAAARNGCPIAARDAAAGGRRQEKLRG